MAKGKETRGTVTRKRQTKTLNHDSQGPNQFATRAIQLNSKLQAIFPPSPQSSFQSHHHSISQSTDIRLSCQSETSYQQFYVQMRKHFSSIEKSKLRRLIEEVMLNNISFRYYIKNLPSETLTISEVCEFQEKVRRHSGVAKSKKGFCRIDSEVQTLLQIRGGYQFLLRKFAQYDYTHFKNSTRYLKQILLRETQKLDGYDEIYYAGDFAKNQNKNVGKYLFYGQNQIGFLTGVKKVSRIQLEDLDVLSKQFAAMLK